MIILNIHTMESLVINNSIIRNKLSDFQIYFDLWLKLRQDPSKRQELKKLTLDLIDALEDKHLKILEDHFKEEIVKDLLNYNLVRNLKFSLEDAELLIPNNNSMPYFSISRNQNQLNITFWR